MSSTSRLLFLCAAVLRKPADSISLGRQTQAHVAHSVEKGGAYLWPSVRGALTDTSGSSPHAGPVDLSTSFAWSWHHPEGRYHTLPYGVALDDQANMYLTTDTSIWKLSPQGAVLWCFYPSPRATIFSSASLLDGRMHFTTLDGRFHAIDMETGAPIWDSKVCDHINYDNGNVMASRGIVFAASDAGPVGVDGEDREGNKMVRAVNASTGATLWTYEPKRPVWNFLGVDAGDGTILYQDWTGGAYRHNMVDGSLIWQREGGDMQSWTDGGPALANGIFYTVSARSWLPAVSVEREQPPSEIPNAPGNLHAFRVSDGKKLWTQTVQMPPNNAPAIGTLPGHSRLSIICPGGYQGMKGGRTSVSAFDAETGSAQWYFEGPPQANARQAGETEGYLERVVAGASPGYVTNPWSAAAIDSNGTVYVGHEDGLIFALRDLDNDGLVDYSDAGEVSYYQTGAAFVGSSSPAIAPGMVCFANCDSVYVFKTP